MQYYPAGHHLCIRQKNFEHVGISDGMGRVYENSFSRNGKGLVSLEEFADGCEITDLGIPVGSLPVAEVLERAQRLLCRPDPYHIMTNNCEHFVREACGLRILSPQILKSYLYVLLAAVIMNFTGLIVFSSAVWLLGWAYGVRRWTIIGKISRLLTSMQVFGKARTSLKRCFVEKE